MIIQSSYHPLVLYQIGSLHNNLLADSLYSPQFLDVINFLKEEYKKTPWKIKDKESINEILEKILKNLKENHLKDFFKQNRLDYRDQKFLSKIIAATPLILDDKYSNIDSMAEIIRIVSNESTIKSERHFRKIIPLFFNNYKSSKFHSVDPDWIAKRGLRKLEEIAFLKKYGIDINSLESRWAWMDIKPELTPRFYRYVIVPEFNRSPNVYDVKREFGGGFRDALREKLGMTIKELQYNAGLSTFFNKDRLDNFFLDKNNPEALLIKNLCFALNFSSSDIGKDLYTKGSSLRDSLISKEITFKRGSYLGFKDDTIKNLETFLKNLPDGAEIKDDFHTLMSERKENALKIFKNYLNIRKAYNERYRFVGSDGLKLKFEWNKGNFEKIQDDVIKTKLNEIYQYNNKRLFPLGALSKYNPRCSDFFIRGSQQKPISPHELQIYSKDLISDGKIEKNSQIGVKLMNYVKELEQNTKETSKFFSVNRFIKHEPILSYIVKNDKNVIGKEIFIWKPINDNSEPRINRKWFITGHIDILLTQNNKIFIADYKPDEKNFLRSLPQVASYGIILSNMLDLDMKKIKCISFNRDESWEYNPSILKDNIGNIVKELKNDHPSLKPKWEKYLQKKIKE